jgi:hypothetical protein
MHFGWLLAKMGDLAQWAELVIGLVVALIYVVNQIFNRESKTQQTKSAKPASRRPATPPGNMKRVPTPPPPGGQPGSKQPDPLLAEIQKFLKQSGQSKAASSRPQPSAGRQSGQPVGSQRGPAVDNPAAKPLDSLAGRHLDTAEVGAGATHLTDDMKRGDAEREQHFEQTFTHKLGSLTDTSVAGLKAIAPPAPSATTQSDEPAAPSDWLILRTGPDDFRRALMLNEILQRPEDRW